VCLIVSRDLSIAFNPDRHVGAYEVHVFAFNTARWDSTGLLRFDLVFTIDNKPVLPGDAQRVAARERERGTFLRGAKEMADAAYRMYVKWERRQISHAETVEGMKQSLLQECPPLVQHA
jgi:hypothetical protein